MSLIDRLGRRNARRFAGLPPRAAWRYREGGVRRVWRACVSMLPIVFATRDSAPAVRAPSGGWVVVPITAESAAVILDAETLVPLVRVRTLAHPQDAIGSPVAARAFVLEMGTESAPEHSVAEIDVPSGRLVRRIDLATCLRPHLAHASRDGSRLWIACVPYIVELDLASAAITQRWALEGAGAWNFDVSGDERTLVTADFDAGSATLLARESGARHVVRLSGKPIGIAVAPRSALAWIGSTGTDSVYVVDLGTGSIQSRFASSGSEPARVAYALDGRAVVITNSRSNSVAVYDAASLRLLRSVPMPGEWPKGVVVGADGRSAFVSLMGSNELVRVDVASGAITGRVVVGKGPERAGWVTRR
jgi:YncE-like protein